MIWIWYLLLGWLALDLTRRRGPLVATLFVIAGALVVLTYFIDNNDLAVLLFGGGAFIAPFLLGVCGISATAAAGGG